jgi:ketosteroid isomerase-like protein
VSAATVRRMLDTLNGEGVEAALPFFHDDFCGVVPPDLSAEPDEYRGHDGVRRYFDSFREIVDDLRFDAEELVEVGEDTVAARGHITGRGRESGIPIEMRVPIAMRLREGKVLEMVGYREWEDALAAARST